VVDLSAHAQEEFCHLTTTGRRTGRPHEIEIWFVLLDGIVYLMAGGGEQADWVRNLRADPNVRLRMGAFEGPATARVVDDDGAHPVRRRMAARYQGWQGDEADLSSWARRALLVAVEPS
jgi:deazaflavin-dependent oxidoreductase (nitroreductase family)